MATDTGKPNLAIRTPSPEPQCNTNHRDILSLTAWFSCLSIFDSACTSITLIAACALSDDDLSVTFPQAQGLTLAGVGTSIIQHPNSQSDQPFGLVYYINCLEYTRKLLRSHSVCHLALDVNRALALRTGSALLDLLKIAVYLFSNNLEEETGLGGFIVWSWQSFTYGTALKHLLRQRHPSIQAFADKLFIYAIEGGEESLVEFLFPIVVNPSNAPHIHNKSAVKAAAKKGTVHTLNLLLGAGPELSEEECSIYLNLALEYRNLEVAKAFLDRGARIDREEKVFRSGIWTALSYATVHCGLDTIKLLRERMPERFRELIHLGNPTAFELAASFGNNDVLLFFHQHGADINYVDSDGCGGALSAAIVNGHIQTARLLISLGADPNQRSGKVFMQSSARHPVAETDWRNAFALEEAVLSNNTELSRVFLENGADPNPAYNFRNSSRRAREFLGPPLVMAVMNENPELTQLLIEAGACINTRHIPGREITPLQCAALVGNQGLVNLLLSKGAALDEEVVVLAAQSGLSDLLQLAIQKGFGINTTAQVVLYPFKTRRYMHQPYEFGLRSVLTAAISSGNDRVVGIALANGANVNNPSEEKYPTPLSMSIECNRIDLCQVLISHGANPCDAGAIHACVAAENMHAFAILSKSCQNQYERDIDSISLLGLCHAIAKSRTDFVRELIRSGIPLDEDKCPHPYVDKSGRTYYYQTPLKEALIALDSDIVKLILDHQVSLNVKDLHELLDWAFREFGMRKHDTKPHAHRELLQIITYLKDAGADLTCDEFCRDSILVYAIFDSDVEVVELLLHHGAVVNCFYWIAGALATPLQVAVNIGDLGIVHTLLEFGADVYAPPGKAKYAGLRGSAIEIAAVNGRLDVMRLLVHAGSNYDARFIQTYPRALRLAYINGNGAIARYLQSFKAENYSHLSCKTDDEILKYLDSENEFDEEGTDSDSEGGTEVDEVF